MIDEPRVIHTAEVSFVSALSGTKPSHLRTYLPNYLPKYLPNN